MNKTYYILRNSNNKKKRYAEFVLIIWGAKLIKQRDMIVLIMYMFSVIGKDG